MVILNICNDAELEEEEEEFNAANTTKARRNSVLSKIKAVGKMAAVFNTLRNERESIMELKSVLNVQKLPPGSLALGAEGIKAAIKTFDDARKADIENERLPPSLESSPTAETPTSRKSFR